MANPYLVAGGVAGFSGVGLGALGAHGLSGQLAASALSSWQTAVLYHLVHAVALLGIGLYVAVGKRSPRGALAKAGIWQVRVLQCAGFAFALGVLLFSGSLYLLALHGPSILGPVTPVGGVSLLIGWLAVLVAGVVRTHE